MKFEEDFPSLCKLNKRTLNLNNLPLFQKDDLKREANKRVNRFMGRIKRDVQTHCLDKEKVKEAINKLTYHVGGGKLDLVYVDDLIKELGLK